MRADGSSVGSCATMTSQGSIPFIILYCELTRTAHELRQGTRRARAQLPASHPAHEEGAHRPALGAGAEGARHRPGISEGFPDLRAPDRARALVARRSEPGIHLLHEKKVRPAASIAAAAVLVLSIPLAAAQSTFTVRVLTPETALKAAQAALKKCRDSGYQATVAVVDRMGVLQVLLRDRFAGPHTPDMARAKAYTAVSFRTNTTELAERTQAGKPQSGIRHRPCGVAVGGGMMIEAGGSLLGAPGVS